MMDLEPPLGIFGGTFDPIHNGHIFPVLEAAEITHIKKVALMPCYIPSHKNVAKVSSQHRLAMVELISAEHALFYADPREIQRAKPTFSIDSMQDFRKERPNTPLCFFIGTDSLQNLSSWHKYEELFSLCHFVVSARKTDSVTHANFSNQVQELLNKRQTHDFIDLHNKLAGHIYVANTQTLTISSTKVRKLLVENESVETFLPSKIFDYIQQHNLYLHSTYF
jgi:nicotinate-nucleotide adenylyltransferase